MPKDVHVLWQVSLAGPGLGGVAATETHVVIGDRDLHDLSDEFRCYAASDGTPLWTLTYPAPGELDYGNTPRTTPLIADGKVYLQGAFGDLHCVDLASGEVVWAKNFELDFGATAELEWGACGSPLLVDGKLIVNPGATDASVVALNPETGEVVWRAPGDPPAYGSFVAAKLGGVLQVVGHDRSSLGGWDVGAGQRLWTLTPQRDDDFNVPTPVIVADKLLVTSENNGTRLYNFDDQGRILPTPLATNQDLASDIGTPVVVGDKAYAIWGELFCLDLNNGLQTVWATRDPSYRVYGSLLAQGERLLVAGASGELLLIDTAGEDCKIVSRLVVFDHGDAELYSHPAIVGSRLFLRGENSLACVDLNAAPSNGRK